MGGYDAGSDLNVWYQSAVEGAKDVRVSVLGPLRVEVDGVPIPLVGRLKHRLLARLALVPRESVDSDGLIEALWGDRAPRTAKQSLHVHISSIRDRLRPFNAERLITTTAEGRYVLGEGDVVVDAQVFEALVAEGSAAHQTGNLRSALDTLGDAVALWGDPYESLSNHYGAMSQRQRLLSIYEQAIDTYVDTLVALGESDRAVPILRSTIAAEPLRERPYLQLMRIYLDQSEPGLASAVFDAATELLRAQLGSHPSRELTELRDSIGPSADFAATDAPGSATQARVELGAHSLVEVPLAADTTPLLTAIRTQAMADKRQVAHGRVVQGDASALSPVLQLAGFHHEPGSSRSHRLRAQLFDRITQRLVARYFVAPVVVIEGIEHASDVLYDYLEAALCRPGPDAFTLVGVHTTSREQLDTRLPPRLSELFRHRISVPLKSAALPDVSSMQFDEVELAVLGLLTCASQPALTELIARSTDRSAAEVAEAIERLVVRRLVTREVDGHLGLRFHAEVVEALGLPDERKATIHLALASALEEWAGLDEAQRVVGQARHRLHAAGAADWESTSAVALRAFTFLESLGAYDDIVALASGSPVAPMAWPQHGSTLGLWVGLGRAQIRAARTEVGRLTLERAIGLARELGDGDLFGEAVRAWLEERSPQRSDDSARLLIAEALELLGPAPSETRVQLLTDMANSSYFVDLDEATSWSEQALALARKGSPATVGRALTGHVQAQLRPHNARQRLEWSLEAQRFARSADSIETLVLALTYEACSLVELGEPRRADPPLRYAAALATEVQVPRFQWWAAAWQALLEFAVGDLESAEERFMAAYELWPSSSRADPFECLACQIATLRFVQGRGAELVPALADLVGRPDAGIEYLAPASLAYAQAGDVGAATDLLGRLVDSSELDPGGTITVPYALALGAETAYLIRDKTAAAVLAARLEPLADVHATLNVWGGGGFYWGSLRHGLGLMYALLGDRAGAELALTQALGEHVEAGVKTFAHRTRHALATLECEPR